MGFMERFIGKVGSHWGVHPSDHKRPAADAPVRKMPMPARLYVPLLQHIGAAARPIVLVGQKVAKGQAIAEPQGMVSATIHAPTSGTVSAIGEIVAPHPSGLPMLAITIDADGEDRWIAPDAPGALPSCADPFALDPMEIGKRVAKAGVVGMGGAAFPSAVKLTGSLRAKISTLIVNGGECEPYLSCDDRLMRDRAADIVDGIRIALHATGAKEALVGIEDNKPEAIAAMQKAAAGIPAVTVRPVPARYPMGSEKQLILVLTGREVPAMGRPSDIGILVHNVGTLVAIRAAIRFGQPLISRLVTLNGGAMRAPGNLEVPIGALADAVIAFANGLKEEPARLLMGGPMMGMQLPDARVPIVKGTSGILALTAAEAAERQPEPCIRCGSCVKACPVGLLPLEMSRRIASADYDGAVDFGLKDCVACGCCAYICPARIPLVQYFNHAKGELSARERTKLRAEATKKLVVARAERIEREAREKAEAAARRKAERDAAKKAAAEAAAANPQPTTEEAES